MCGIVGALAFGNLPKDKEAIRQEVMRIITTELMLITEARGKDATGAVVLFKDGNFFGVKRGTKATSFLAKFGTGQETYGGFLEVWKKTKVPVKAFVGHCRQGTVGALSDNKNNHPIKIGNIVGVHNGTLKNDDVIIENLGCKRDGEVDSEAIFRLAAHFTNNGEEPFTTEILGEIVHRLNGAFSVIMFNADSPTQVAVFRDGRPMEFVFVRDLGLLFIISEKPFWDSAQYIYERIANYYKSNVPSLLGMEIEKGELQNDGAAVFDLTTKITEETKIKDLGEWEKLPGAGRIWQAKTYTTTTTTPAAGNTSTPAAGTSTSAVSTTTTPVGANTPPAPNNAGGATQEGKTRRYVFNEVTVKYDIKVGDKVLSPEESANIEVQIEKPAEEGNKDTNKTVSKPETTSDNTGNEDTPTTVKIIDMTNYKVNELNKPVIKTETAGKEIVVDMTQEPPELVEAAGKSFRELDIKTRGFENMDKLLDAVEIADMDKARALSILAISNRVFRFAWMKGFIAGCKYASELFRDKMNDVSEAEKKTKKREKHIVGLKALVVLLAQYFNISKEEDKFKLSEIMTEQDNKPDMEELDPIFHGWQKDKLKRVAEVVGSSSGTDDNSSEE